MGLFSCFSSGEAPRSKGVSQNPLSYGAHSGISNAEAGLRQDLEYAQNRIQQLSAQISALEASASSDRKAVAASEAKVQLLTAELDAVKAETSKAAAQPPQTQVSTSQQFAELHTSNKELQVEVERTQEQLEQCKAELEIAQREKQSIQDQFEQVFDKEQAAQQEVLRLEAEVAELQAQLGSAQLNQLGQEEISEHLISAQAALQESLARCAGLEARLASLAEENDKLMLEHKEVKQVGNKAAFEASRQHGELVVVHGELQVAVERMRKELAAREAELAGVLAAVAAAKAEAAEARQQAAQAQADLDAHLVMNETMSSTMGALLSDYHALKAEHAALQSEMHMRDEMMELLQQQLADVADMDLDSIIATSLSRARTVSQATARTPAASGAISRMSGAASVHTGEVKPMGSPATPSSKLTSPVNMVAAAR